MTNAQGAARRGPQTILNGATATWLALALIGQWAFFGYIAAFYGPNLAEGNYQAWAGLSRLGATAYVPGDTTGNVIFGLHALAAGLIALGGALQLIPQVRSRFPAFHRWNGRIYLLTVAGLAVSGFWLIWIRQSSPVTLTQLCTSLNGLLILGFGALAWRKAASRDFASHRRWALRLYLVSNGQWFLRIGLFAYMVGATLLGAKASPGPFLRFWAAGCFLLPLALLELYFWARARDNGWAGNLTAGAIAIAGAAMSVGAVTYSLFAFTLVAGGKAGLP